MIEFEDEMRTAIVLSTTLADQISKETAFGVATKAIIQKCYDTMVPRVAFEDIGRRNAAEIRQIASSLSANLTRIITKDSEQGNRISRGIALDDHERGKEVTIDDVKNEVLDIPGFLIDHATGYNANRVFGDRSEVTIREVMREKIFRDDIMLLLKVAIGTVVDAKGEKPIDFPDSLKRLAKRHDVDEDALLEAYKSEVAAVMRKEILGPES